MIYLLNIGFMYAFFIIGGVHSALTFVANDFTTKIMLFIMCLLYYIAGLVIYKNL